MGYLFLLPALFFTVTKGYSGKKTSGLVSGFEGASFVSLLRIFLCMIFGAALIVPEILSAGVDVIKISPKILAISLVSGITNAAILVAWILLVKKGALLLIDSAGMCGVFIPLILSNLFYSETLKINHIFGVLLLIVAVSILYVYNKSVKPKITFLTIILLVFYGLSNGLADFSGKAFSKISQGNVSTAIFNFYTYIFAFLGLGVYYLCVRMFNKNKKSEISLVLFKNSIWYVIIMAISLYLTTFFKTLSAGYLPSATLYPLYQAAMLILNGAMGAVFFGEKVTSKSIIAVVISILAIVFINVI